ncbi:hypothetical protein AB0N64_02460 [Microbacterium sp. NPDC089318]
MRPSGPTLAAAIVLALEGVALGVVCLIELLALGSGQTASNVSGIALIVLTVLAAVALGAFSWGTLRRASWARSGGVVFQALGVALGLASLSIEPKVWLFTLAVGGTALIGLVLLISATRRDGASDPRLRGEEDPRDPA